MSDQYTDAEKACNARFDKEAERAELEHWLNQPEQANIEDFWRLTAEELYNSKEIRAEQMPWLWHHMRRHGYFE